MINHPVCNKCCGKGCSKCHNGWECIGHNCNKCKMGWAIGGMPPNKLWAIVGMPPNKLSSKTSQKKEFLINGKTFTLE